MCKIFKHSRKAIARVVSYHQCVFSWDLSRLCQYNTVRAVPSAARTPAHVSFAYSVAVCVVAALVSEFIDLLMELIVLLLSSDSMSSVLSDDRRMGRSFVGLATGLVTFASLIVRLEAFSAISASVAAISSADKAFHRIGGAVVECFANVMILTLFLIPLRDRAAYSA